MLIAEKMTLQEVISFIHCHRHKLVKIIFYDKSIDYGIFTSIDIDNCVGHFVKNHDMLDYNKTGDESMVLKLQLAEIVHIEL